MCNIGGKSESKGRLCNGCTNRNTLNMILMCVIWEGFSESKREITIAELEITLNMIFIMYNL